MVEIERVLDLWRQGGMVMPFLTGCLFAVWYGTGYRLVSLNQRVLARAGELLRARQITDPDKAMELILPLREGLDRHRALVKAVTLVAPLAGLLGTVTGMIETFDSLGSMTMFRRGGGIGEGIGEALVSTQMGLVVATPGILLGALLDRRQEVIEDRLDELVAGVRGIVWRS